MPPLSDVPFIATHPAINNARSGVQGHAHPSSNNKIIPAALADYADGALLALKSVAQDNPLKTKLPEYGAHLLGERMALFNTHPGEQVSAGGSCHFFEARNGHLAINLARDEDFDLLPALTDAQIPITTDKQILENAFKKFSIQDLIPLGRDLGLAISAVALPDYDSFDNWVSMSPSATSQYPSPKVSPLVVDLSSLGGGPLSGCLLGLLGA
ncbi:MAG: hypothetical protein VXY55_02515 [Pseudomonadota bacterium]|nr:hypothetical protein [Pseudomonadota bacterium]